LLTAAADGLRTGGNHQAAYYPRRPGKIQPVHVSREKLLPPAAPAQDRVNGPKIFQSQFAPHAGHAARFSGQPQAKGIILWGTHFPVYPGKQNGEGWEPTLSQR